jgi:hypothetical protein
VLKFVKRNSSDKLSEEGLMMVVTEMISKMPDRDIHHLDDML